MKFGIVLPIDAPGPLEAEQIEALEFDYVAAGEHVFFSAPTTNAFVALSAAAAVTARVRLVSTVTLLPLYPGALAAKMAAELDRLSNGRFELGVGVGGEYPAEFEACGVPVSSRGARADEALEQVPRLLRGELLTIDGRFSRLRDVLLDPPPVQARIPIWIAGRRQAAKRRAARHAHVWLPYMYTPEMLASSLKEIRRDAELLGRADPVRGALFAWTCVDPDRDEARRLAIETVSAVYNQDFAPLADRYLIAGTPEDVRDRLEEYRLAGAEIVILALASPADRRAEMLGLLAAEVVPAFR